MTDGTEDELGEIAQRWIEDAYVTKPSLVPDVVYHYTDAAGFAGMLRTSIIWATDYRFLNDKSEIEHTRDMVRRIIRHRHTECQDDLDASFYDGVAKYNSKESSSDVFIFSLSEQADDLSQWRGYAREGQGFTIGFCGQSLAQLAGFEKEYSFFKVEYDQNRQERAITQVVDSFEKCIRKLSSADGCDKETMCDRAAQFFHWFAESRAAVNKHRSFTSESEWRVLSYVVAANRAAEVKVRSSGLRLVNYTELHPRFPDTDKLPIKRIGVGPGFYGPEQIDAVKAVCRETGYDPDIYCADTPYRRV